MDARRACAALGCGLALAGLSTRALAALFERSELRDLCLSTLALELVLAGATLFLAAGARRAPRDALGLAPWRASAPRLCLVALGALGLSAALDGGLTRSGLRDASVLASVDELLRASSGSDLVLATAALVLAPALAEELLCRGLVQRALAARVAPGFAVLGASVLFGALHLEWIQGGAAALLGVYLGLVAWRLDSTRPAVLCHLLNNGVALASSALELPFDGSRTPVLVAGLALAAAGLAALPRAAPLPGTVEPAHAAGGASPVVSTLQSERRSDDS